MNAGGTIIMKQRMQGIIIGLLIATFLFGGTAFALTGSRTVDITYRDIKIVVDGTQITPRDANGNVIEPFLYNGSTFLPVRAVSEALNKDVKWVGETNTVYIGKIPGQVQTPDLWLQDAINIGNRMSLASVNNKTDNYGGTYNSAYYFNYNSGGIFQTLLDGRYSRFKGVFYIAQGTTNKNDSEFMIEVDGNIIYSSSAITNTSRPISVDLDITGKNDFKIIIKQLTRSYGPTIYIADAGFFQ